jgi:hypothetical protein
VDASPDAQRTAAKTAAKDGRFRSVAMMVIFDVGAPLATYYILRSAGWTAVSALLLSGVFPTVHVATNAVRNRRLDMVGALVLGGIALGTVLGLVSHSAKWLLAEASVPTGVFGVACLISLWARYPLMFRLALEFNGPDTAKGREITMFWHHQGFRHSLRVITAVWGVGFLIEAALKIVIIYNTSTGTAFATSTVTPIIWVAIFLAWTVAYGARQKKKFERIAAAFTPSEVPGADPVPPPAQTTAEQDRHG